jgi:hypothetical protein
MPARQLHLEPEQRDLVLRFPPNWTAVIFLSILGSLHLCIAIPAFLTGHFEGEMSLLLGSVFLLAATGFRLLRSELSIVPAKKLIRQSVWLGRVWHSRETAFGHVREVRLFLAGPRGESHTQIVCHNDSVECPPTAIPRQQALYLAMMMDVPLVKICAEPPIPPTPATRLDELPHSHEIAPDDSN